MATKAKIAEAKPEREVTKIDSNTFEVSQSVTRTVDKKALAKEIEDLKKVISDMREKTGIAGLENNLAEKEELLAELK